MLAMLHKMNHVNSNPIGMGNLCSTLQSLDKRCMRVDRRGVCGVLSFFSFSFISEGSDRVCQYLYWRGFTRVSEKIELEVLRVDSVDLSLSETIDSVDR